MDKIVDHHIQKHIIGVLIHRKYARFRDLRPLKTDTNLFSYHLKSLIKDGFIEKQVEGYTLSVNGLAYVDRVSLKKMNVRSQPKIITMLIIRDALGRILLQRRTKQPYIDTWTLPYGKTHISDKSLEMSASRETLEKVGFESSSVMHIGDVYIRVVTSGSHLSTTLAHIFDVTITKKPDVSADLMWYANDGRIDLAPAVATLLDTVSNSDGYFFAEIEEVWH